MGDIYVFRIRSQHDLVLTIFLKICIDVNGYLVLEYSALHLFSLFLSGPE